MDDHKQNGVATGVLLDAPTAVKPKRRPNKRQQITRGERAPAVGTAIKSGRTNTQLMSSPPGAMIPPPDHESGWRMQELDTNALDRMSTTQLMEYLANLSPEISKGLWDYLRLLNPGWEYEVMKPGTDTPSAQGKQIIQALIDRMKMVHGSFDVVINRLHMGGYLRGAYFAELVLSGDSREGRDIATPDPATVRFRASDNPDGPGWAIGQWQAGKWVDLSGLETISYLPVDPFPGSPYGRSLVAPATFSALFLIGLLHDLRRVISQQGWPRIDIVVDTQKIIEALEAAGDVDQEDIDQAITNAVNSVRDTYTTLQPDDAYVHSEEVDIKGPIGVTNGANLGGIDSIIEVIERMLTRALKTMPLMLGITDGVSEANANRQWEITVAGVKSMQHLCESIFERFFELLCRLQGVQVDVKFTFAEIRAAEEQRDALTLSQRIDNWSKLVAAGIASREEFADDILHHEPALSDEEQAAKAPDTSTDDKEEAEDNDTNPESGEGEVTGKSAKASGWRFRAHDSKLIVPVFHKSRAAYREEMRRRGSTYYVTENNIQHGKVHPDDGRQWWLAGTWYYDGIPLRDEYDVYD